MSRWAETFVALSRQHDTVDTMRHCGGDPAIVSHNVHSVTAPERVAGGSAWHEAVAYWSALHPPDEAERLAWGAVQMRWHRQHGERIAPHLCAGCGEPIGKGRARDLIDGNRVHLGGLDCLIRFGHRWRAAATAGLAALGLAPPVATDGCAYAGSAEARHGMIAIERNLADGCP